MSVDIRPAQPSDKARCLAMIEALTGQEPTPGWPAAFDTLLDGTRGEILVADAGEGGLLGVTTVSYNVAIRYGGEYCQLEEIIVDPAARGQNLGGLLLQAVIDRARARGCAEIGLYLLPHTERNWPYYEKYGFEKVGTELRQRLDQA